MKKILQLLAVPLLALGAFLIPASPASAVPITPTITSCTSAGLAFFPNRICVDPTTASGRVVRIYTNGVLQVSYGLGLVNHAYGCRANNVFSGAWYPASFNGWLLSGFDGTGSNPSVSITSERDLSCQGGFAYLTNTYYLQLPALLTIAGYRTTHTLIHVA